MKRGLARLKKLYDLNASLVPAVADVEFDKERLFLEGSFHEFVKAAFIHGWHTIALCEHLEAAIRGQIHKLLINIPPRTGKSNIISVMLPAWVWTVNPSVKFLYASYAQKISFEHSRLCRMLVESHWYQERWGFRVKISKDQATK